MIGRILCFLLGHQPGVQAWRWVCRHAHSSMLRCPRCHKEVQA